jgi:DNA-binding NarL/FixJ family response regulator
VTKVLIAEARAMSGDTMAIAVRRAHGFVLSGRCTRREEVAAACALAVPDVAVLDLELYEQDARYAVSSLREHAASSRVLLMTPEPDTEQLARAALAGAENCISARADRTTFVRALRATADGRSVLTPEVEHKIVRLIVELGDTDGRRLSPRECEVLRLAARGLPTEKIASQLVISVNTARTHLQRAYRKLGASNRIGAVASATTKGLLR